LAQATAGILAHDPVSVVGLILPEDCVYDSVNLLPFILALQTKPPHQRLHWKSIYASFVRQDRWKLINNHRQNTVRLYDLEADRGEMRNLADEQTEIVRHLLGVIKGLEGTALPSPLA
jgi:hypothetical protein